MALTKYEKPCWYATCDECGRDELDSEGQTHYQSEAEAREAIERCGFKEIGGRLMCEDCAKDAAQER
jgi:hypothetical protein